MARWTIQRLSALILGLALPAAVIAQPTTPPVTPPTANPPPATHPGAALPQPTPGSGVVVPNAVIYGDPFQAATPYNPTVVNQSHPNAAFNRPNMTLPCNIPNQNTSPFEPRKHGCFKKNVWGNAWDNCGCSVGNNSGCNDAKHPILTKIAHPYAGFASKGGACTTVSNTGNFIFASSRSFYGESSREFFERPPSPDGVKMLPRKYNLPPAPGSFVPPDMIVQQPYPVTGVNSQYWNSISGQQP